MGEGHLREGVIPVAWGRGMQEVAHLGAEGAIRPASPFPPPGSCLGRRGASSLVALMEFRGLWKLFGV